jgi:hypothetical protein
MQRGTAGLGEFVARLSQNPAFVGKVGDYAGRLSRLLGIVDVDSTVVIWGGHIGSDENHPPLLGK